MRILILGGSVFLGRAFVTEALTRGHQVTTFNRGTSGPDLPGVQVLRGDAATTRTWSSWSPPPPARTAPGTW